MHNRSVPVRTGREFALALALVALLAGCDLGKGNGGCSDPEPGMTAAHEQLCVQPPPTQFNQMNP